MKQLRYFLLFILLFQISCHKPSISSVRYFISEASIDETDLSDYYFERGQYLTFYEEGDGRLCFLNSSRKQEEYSYGQIHNLSRQYIEVDGCSGETLYFRWSYKNSYDNNKGYAFVKITTINHENGNEFSAIIVTKNLEKIEFSGFTNDFLENPKKYDFKSGYLYAGNL
jgi:hypothetical protein